MHGCDTRCCTWARSTRASRDDAKKVVTCQPSWQAGGSGGNRGTNGRGGGEEAGGSRVSASGQACCRWTARLCRWCKWVWQCPGMQRVRSRVIAYDASGEQRMHAVAFPSHARAFQASLTHACVGVHPSCTNVRRTLKAREMGEKKTGSPNVCVALCSLCCASHVSDATSRCRCSSSSRYACSASSPGALLLHKESPLPGCQRVCLALSHASGGPVIPIRHP